MKRIILVPITDKNVMGQLNLTQNNSGNILPFRNWHSEHANIKCACESIIHIKSTLEQYQEILCDHCHLMYKVWNNGDGSGLRMNVKGYFPFYPSGYKFIISRIINEIT